MLSHRHGVIVPRLYAILGFSLPHFKTTNIQSIAMSSKFFIALLSQLYTIKQESKRNDADFNKANHVVI